MRFADLTGADSILGVLKFFFVVVVVFVFWRGLRVVEKRREIIRRDSGERIRGLARVGVTRVEVKRRGEERTAEDEHVGEGENERKRGMRVRASKGRERKRRRREREKRKREWIGRRDNISQVSRADDRVEREKEGREREGAERERGQIEKRASERKRDIPSECQPQHKYQHV